MFGKVPKNPGPGTYAAIGIKPDGVYAPSNHARTRTPLIKRDCDGKPKRYDRVPYYGKYVPGPGWYDLTGDTISALSKKKTRDSVVNASLHSFGG